MSTISAGDAQSLLNHFKKRQIEDPMFFYTIQVDQENRMTNFFWRDGRSGVDYDCFGDVVVFDTTYYTNRYCRVHFWEVLYCQANEPKPNEPDTINLVEKMGSRTGLQ